MRRFVYNAAVVLSTLAFTLMVLVWISLGDIDPRAQYVSLSSFFHVSLHRWHNVDVRVVFFNDATYGPYSGSIIGMVSGNSTQPASRPAWPKVTAFGDTAGVYYRVIRFEDGTKWGTLAISLGYPQILTAVLPLIWVVRHYRSDRRGFPVGGWHR